MKIIGVEMSDQLEGLEAVVRNMYLEGQITEQQYQIQLISLAESYVLEDKVNEAKNLISRLSSDFIQKLPQLLENNDVLRMKALTVAEFLELNTNFNEEESQVDLLLANMDRTQKPS